MNECTLISANFEWRTLNYPIRMQMGRSLLGARLTLPKFAGVPLGCAQAANKSVMTPVRGI